MPTDGQPARTETDPAPRCDTCGDESAIVVEGAAYCAGCYHVCGSCCADDPE